MAMSIFNFLCNVLEIVVCPFVLFLLAIVLSVFLLFRDSYYPFGIFKLFSEWIKQYRHNSLLNKQIRLRKLNVGESSTFSRPNKRQWRTCRDYRYWILIMDTWFNVETPTFFTITDIISMKMGRALFGETIYVMGVSCGAGTIYPFRAHEFT